MKAIRMHGYGHSDQLSLDDVPEPQPKTTEVLVEIHSAAINPVEWKIREGLLKERFPVNFPEIAGHDFAGRILAVGAEVTEFKIGDEVFGFTAGGAYAEKGIAAATDIARKPSNLDFDESASLGTAALTAWQALINLAGLQHDQTVLIHGGGGGVGSFACQVAKWRGAQVIATCSGEDREYLQSLGIDELIDYKKEDFAKKVKDVDVVFDLVGGETLTKSLDVLKPNGFIVTAVGELKDEDLSKRGLRGLSMKMERDAIALAEIAKLAEQGYLVPRMARVLDLEDAAEAQDIVQNEHPHGKVALSVSHA